MTDSEQTKRLSLACGLPLANDRVTDELIELSRRLDRLESVQPPAPQEWPSDVVKVWKPPFGGEFRLREGLVIESRSNSKGWVKSNWGTSVDEWLRSHDCTRSTLIYTRPTPQPPGEGKDTVFGSFSHDGDLYRRDSNGKCWAWIVPSSDEPPYWCLQSGDNTWWSQIQTIPTHEAEKRWPEAMAALDPATPESPKAGEEDEARKWAKRIIAPNPTYGGQLSVWDVSGHTPMNCGNMKPDGNRNALVAGMTRNLLAFSRTRMAELERELADTKHMLDHNRNEVTRLSEGHMAELRAQLAAAEVKGASLECEIAHIKEHIAYWKCEAETHAAEAEKLRRALVAARDERDEAWKAAKLAGGGA
jgi:hypothetical protein